MQDRHLVTLDLSWNSMGDEALVTFGMLTFMLKSILLQGCLVFRSSNLWNRFCVLCCSMQIWILSTERFHLRYERSVAFIISKSLKSCGATSVPIDGQWQLTRDSFLVAHMRLGDTWWLKVFLGYIEGTYMSILLTGWHSDCPDAVNQQARYAFRSVLLVWICSLMLLVQ